MRHQVANRKLGRTTSHRWAMFRNMATSLIEHERIETTLHKAKELRSFAEYLITLGKENTLHSRRQALSFVRNNEMVQKLFSDLAPRFKDRKGGYTRILKMGFRYGDSAAMALIEYLQDGKAAVEAGDKKTKAKEVKAEKPKKEVKAKAPKAPTKVKVPKAKKEKKEPPKAKAKKKPAAKKAK